MKQMKHKYLNQIITLLLILLLSAFIMTVTFIFSSANLNQVMFDSYFRSIELMLMNILPIFIFMSIVYILSNRLWVGFATTSLLFVVASLVNKFKLTYRDEPFIFMDIKLISESMAMTKRYDIAFTWRVSLILLSFLVISILLKKFFKYRIDSIKFRVSIGLIIVIVFSLSFEGLYFNKDRYEKLGDKSLINIWSDQQQFQSKGFVYPFMHSISEARDEVLEGYDEEKAIADLKNYQYSDIPDDKRVNVIGIMLEAYNDFSKFEGVEVDEEVYKNFHEIQKESLHGNLITNIFGGGTINTERGFLTGYQNHPKYLKKTNSFAWYFKEQGYKTKAMHPFLGWFYNRRNINEYLGFDSFDYYENKYEKINKDYLDDMEFFDFIKEDYKKTVDKGEDYFHFSVSFQNHGPYPSEQTVAKEYLKRKEGYNESDYNIINNYLKGISETDKALKDLTDYLEEQNEPVVLVFFGDHNPWLGEKSTGYDMLGISMDPSNEEGFLNYYQTPYVIWGNTSAKDMLDKDFIKESEDISPNFLMSELFDYLGWTGNEYMQYLSDLRENIDVNHNSYYKENKKYTKKLSESGKEIYKNYVNLQYYYGRNFIDKKEVSK